AGTRGSLVIGSCSAGDFTVSGEAVCSVAFGSCCQSRSRCPCACSALDQGGGAAGKDCCWTNNSHAASRPCRQCSLPGTAPRLLRRTDPKASNCSTACS